MQCAESLRVQAYFDGEVDAVSAADIERHIEHCAECRALLADLEQLRSVLRATSTYARTPPLLRARIMRALDEESADSAPRRKRRGSSESGERPFWMGAAGGLGAPAIAATVAFLFLAAAAQSPGR